jgi:hypothetical protein
MADQVSPHGAESARQKRWFAPVTEPVTKRMSFDRCGIAADFRFEPIADVTTEGAGAFSTPQEGCSVTKDRVIFS